MCMRLHINLEEGLVREIDEVAGKRGRSAFIRDAVAQEVDRRRRAAALERAFGSAPDFAPWMTPESISAERKRESEERDAKLREHLARHDSAD